MGEIFGPLCIADHDVALQESGVHRPQHAFPGSPIFQCLQVLQPQRFSYVERANSQPNQCTEVGRALQCQSQVALIGRAS